MKNKNVVKLFLVSWFFCSRSYSDFSLKLGHPTKNIHLKMYSLIHFETILILIYSFTKVHTTVSSKWKCNFWKRNCRPIQLFENSWTDFKSETAFWWNQKKFQMWRIFSKLFRTCMKWKIHSVVSPMVEFYLQNLSLSNIFLDFDK